MEQKKFYLTFWIISIVLTIITLGFFIYGAILDVSYYNLIAEGDQNISGNPDIEVNVQTAVILLPLVLIFSIFPFGIGCIGSITSLFSLRHYKSSLYMIIFNVVVMILEIVNFIVAMSVI